MATDREKVEAATADVIRTTVNGFKPDRVLREKMYREVRKRTGLSIKQSSWEVAYFYPIRKRLQKKKTEPKDVAEPKASVPVPSRPTIPEVSLGLEPAPGTLHARESIYICRKTGLLEAVGNEDGTWDLALKMPGVESEKLADFLDLAHALLTF